MKNLVVFFIILLFNGGALARTSSRYVENAKAQLHQNLHGAYLQEVMALLGECNYLSSQRECLNFVGDWVTLKTSAGEACYPYTMCGYYQCMEERYQCSRVGFPYLNRLAYPACKYYERNIQRGHFTRAGVEWVYQVMVCLQKKLFEECEVKGSCPAEQEDRQSTCGHITEITLDHHLSCYLDSGVGVCHLPFKDKMGIWRTLSKFLTPREIEEAYKIIFHCIKPWLDGPY